MQVNTKWHMDGFFELADMLDLYKTPITPPVFCLICTLPIKAGMARSKHYHSSDPAKHVQYHARVLGELETYLAAHNAPLGAAAPVY